MRAPQILALDLAEPAHRQALTALLQHYACDPMGGGQPLAQAVLAALPQALAARTDYAGFLARCEGEWVGLLNAFEGFSTFAARPLLNIHDLVVHAGWRGRGVARHLLGAAQAHALRRGCCKLTLEVLSANRPALARYRAFGFAAYTLDPAAGQALFLQKWLTEDADVPAA